jgi:hypothetical protein
MRKPRIIALLAASVFTPFAMAQMRGPTLTMPGSVASSGFARGVNVSFSGRPRSHAFGPGLIFLGDGFYQDYPVAPLSLSPQYVVVQPPTIVDMSPETKSEPLTSEPLMIELQGNRYVRFGGRQQSAERGTTAPPDYAAAEAGNSSRAQIQSELPPTVLIFRDGHREQVPEYAIVGSTLYAHEDYWQSGLWMKNIQLSTLNIPATVRANQDNGIKFALPSAPNEVITRP